ncbi:protein RKD5 isoform X2 [Rosa rugosa]|uniref:protein RKD5 isoform X2 n=1 Tax=Rosa rugosa TaxID=74645 RepID=UPI002B401036|nr:protein RKD5 isoform X2 [Rosa rugosa]
MDSCDPHFLRSLLVFKNTINQGNGSYVEFRAYPVLRLMKFRVSQVLEGYVNGCWVCILAFHANRSPNFTCTPSILSVSRNPQLKLIPNLANDLQMVVETTCIKAENLQKSDEETSQGNDENHCQLRRSLPMLDLDLNRPPCPATMSESSDDQESGRQSPGLIEKKNRRAASDRIAKITLPDLVKYFDIPIVEASRSLNVGLTVLKKKCREFGIPRWPHRKIKSLDSLIRDLQEETGFQQKENKAAALAVAKRQRMLESEKESIERRPFLDMKIETKRFRQDVFKRRHRARVLRSQGLSLSGN